MARVPAFADPTRARAPARGVTVLVIASGGGLGLAALTGTELD